MIPIKTNSMHPQTRVEKEGYPDVVTYTLKVLQLDFYALIETNTNLSFVMPYVD